MAMKPNEVNLDDEPVVKKTSSIRKEKGGTDVKRKNATKSSHYREQEDIKDIYFDNSKDTKSTSRNQRNESRSTHYKEKKETGGSYPMRQDELKENHFKRKKEMRSTHSKKREEPRNTHSMRHADKTLEMGSLKSDKRYKEARYYSEEHSFEKNLKPKRTEYSCHDKLK
jgi:hypothetical protein